MKDSRLGIITNNPDAVFQRSVIMGIEEVAAECEYATVVQAYERHSEQALPGLADLDGLLVISNALPDDLLRHIYESRKPISLVSHQVADLSIPVVMSNNVQGIAELVRHLVRCQRRDLVFIRGLMDQNDGQERELSLRQEFVRCKLNVPESHFLRGDFTPEVAAESVKRVLEQGLNFDAIVASDYVMAIAAIEVLRSAGISVPGDVSVVGFGDGPEAELAWLTTVAANITELGRCAARQLIRQIKGLRISGVTMLSVKLIVRESCGCKVATTGE